MVATALVPLPARRLYWVSAAAPLPPFATDRIPVTSLVARLTAAEDSRPELFEWSSPVEKIEIVGACETVKLVMVVVANVEAPATFNVPEMIWLPLVVALPVIRAL